ncbi:MAG: FtsQ-type POTRA domain-containing protein [Bacteroidetes bacterium]|nr:FtsQ-type POTRA domain-containing protein [Bacteroidota bacterium]
MSEERIRWTGVVALVGLVLLLVVGGNLWKSNLRVKRVAVAGAVNVETNQIIQLAEIPTGTPLYGVDLTRVQRNVQSHYFIRRATVERDLSGGIRITVEERTPLAVILGSPLWYVDDRGVVLPSSISKAVYDLPVLAGIPPGTRLAAGTAIEKDDVQEALLLLNVLKRVNREMFHRISEIRVRDGGDMVLTSAESGVPIIFGRGEIADKVARLEAFWASEVLERGTKDLEYIDLRYRDQVVVRWAPEQVKKRL